jgi:hypothetical protein
MESEMTIIHKTLRVAAAASAFLALLTVAESASASTWAQNHPRRAEVNQRLANQNHRINRELREGEITRGQAHALHAQDHAIRSEERFMASQRGGHITGAEQRALNQQENAVSHNIGH